jgi:SAM-dependent methyltransferase
MKDLFSRDAASYAKYRPRYPKELFQWLASQCKHTDIAWDCATGNGQAAIELSRIFSKVVGTDISANQLSAAIRVPNINYELTGTNCNLPDKSVDLITIAQALHWLPLEQFYSEVKRVAAPAGIIAAWIYGLLEINTKVDDVIQHFYEHDLNGCWDPARAHIDEGYRYLSFPFKTVDAPAFYIRELWSLEQLTGYLNTWSAIPVYIDKYHCDPIPDLTKKLYDAWGPQKELPVIFPLQLKIGYVH